MAILYDTQRHLPLTYVVASSPALQLELSDNDQIDAALEQVRVDRTVSRVSTAVLVGGRLPDVQSA